MKTVKYIYLACFYIHKNNICTYNRRNKPNKRNCECAYLWYMYACTYVQGTMIRTSSQSFPTRRAPCLLLRELHSSFENFLMDRISSRTNRTVKIERRKGPLFPGSLSQTTGDLLTLRLRRWNVWRRRGSLFATSRRQLKKKHIDTLSILLIKIWLHLLLVPPSAPSLYIASWLRSRRSLSFRAETL